jgi:tetratricopeptide (TPR) repeat protein
MTHNPRSVEDYQHRKRRLPDRLLIDGSGYINGRLVQLQLSTIRCPKALDATPKDHPDRAHLLQSLGITYQSIYQEFGAIGDLEIAIKQFQEAFDITLKDYPDRARQLDSLWAGYKGRYLRTGAIADLDIVITRY